MSVFALVQTYIDLVIHKKYLARKVFLPFTSKWKCWNLKARLLIHSYEEHSCILLQRIVTRSLMIDHECILRKTKTPRMAEEKDNYPNMETKTRVCLLCYFVT